MNAPMSSYWEAVLAPDPCVALREALGEVPLGTAAQQQIKATQTNRGGTAVRLEEFFAEARAGLRQHVRAAEFESPCPSDTCGGDTIVVGDEIVFSHEHDAFVHLECHEDWADA